MSRGAQNSGGCTARLGRACNGATILGGVRCVPVEARRGGRHRTQLRRRPLPWTVRIEARRVRTSEPTDAPLLSGPRSAHMANGRAGAPGRHAELKAGP